MPKPVWIKSSNVNLSFFSSKVHVEVHKPPANIQWEKGTQGFSTQNETLPFHPLHCCPKTASGCSIVLNFPLNFLLHSKSRSAF